MLVVFSARLQQVLTWSVCSKKATLEFKELGHFLPIQPLNIVSMTIQCHNKVKINKYFYFGILGKLLKKIKVALILNLYFWTTMVILENYAWKWVFHRRLSWLSQMFTI